MTPDEKFAAIAEKIKTDPAAWGSFLNDPVPVLEAAGVPVIRDEGALSAALKTHTVVLPAAAAAVAGTPTPAVSATSHWWGIDIVFDKNTTKWIIGGTFGAGALSSAISAALIACLGTGPIGGYAVGAAALAIGGGMALVALAKTGEMALVNRGNGVHFPITWLQWAPCVAAIPSGPAGVELAMLIFIHPLPN